MSRRVVVSGGGTGIGRAIARRFAAGGDEVAIIGRRREVVERTADEINGEVGRNAVTPHPADLEDPAAVEALARALTAGGPIDILVNNAGGTIRSSGTSLADVAEQWSRTYRNNVLSTVMLTAALLSDITRPGGRIVAMSSVAALRGAGAYGAAKAALHAWVYDQAATLGPEGITVNAVAPGFVPDTEFWEGRRTDQVAAPRIAGTLVKKPGTPDEVAEAVVYLASPLSGFTTGQILQVNGGTALGRG